MAERMDLAAAERIAETPANDASAPRRASLADLPLITAPLGLRARIAMRAGAGQAAYQLKRARA